MPTPTLVADMGSPMVVGPPPCLQEVSITQFFNCKLDLFESIHCIPKSGTISFLLVNIDIVKDSIKVK